MKREFGKILFLMTLLLVPGLCQAQMKIYTKSYRIQDFRSRTTRIVLDGPTELTVPLREEVTSLWTVSPYEFCSAAEYEKLKTDPDSYFLRAVTSKGIISLELAKGGREGDSNTLKKPLSLVTVPIAGENSLGTLQYMAAWVSIVQDYIDSAIGSERVAYSGIGTIRAPRPAMLKIIRDPKEAAIAFRNADALTAVEITITPDGTTATRPRYRYIIGTDNYALYAFRK